MLKKLLLCTCVLVSLNASADLNISFENHTNKVVMVSNVTNYYSDLLDVKTREEIKIGGWLEIEPGSVVNFDISVEPILYFRHRAKMTFADEIALEVMDPSKPNSLEKFSISWEQDSAQVEFEKTFPYKLSQKKEGNAQFIFTLESK